MTTREKEGQRIDETTGRAMDDIALSSIGLSCAQTGHAVSAWSEVFDRLEGVGASA